MKKKSVAAILALFLGIWGVHRYYLGQRFLGILYGVLFFFGLIITVEEGFPAVALPAVIGFIDAVLFAVMPREDFDEKYNRRYLYGDEKRAPRRRRRESYQQRPRTPKQATTTDRIFSYKRRGIDKFRDYDYEGAVEEFEKALEIKFEDSSLHFNLAACFSILEEADKAFYHLEKAVEFGFNDFDKIKNHDALAFLRTMGDFDLFVANGYKRVSALPQPQEDLLSAPPASDNLLEQIKRLGDLRDKGVLTQEEFTRQKRKLLEEM